MTLSVSLGLWRPHVQTAVQRINSLYPSTSIGTYLGHDPDRSLAADLMIPNYRTEAGKAFGWEVARWCWAHAEELGIWYVIYDGKIISRTPGKGTWRTYTPTAAAIRASRDSAYHYNHVHLSFYSTAPAEPVARPVWLDRLVPGVTDSDSVRLVQRALGVPQTGTYDAATVAAVKARQVGWGDDPRFCDGVLGPKQAELLFSQAQITVDIRTDPSGEAPPPVVVPPVTPKPPKPATPPKGDTVPTISVVDLNVLRRTDPEAGKARLEFDDRLEGLVAAIKAGDPVLVLLQELDLTTATKIVTRLGPSWTWERKNGIGIAWDRDVLERTGEAVWHLFTDRDNRYLLSVPLRHEASGVEFWADVSHLENDGDTATDGHAARFLQSSEIATRTGKGMRVFGADLNSTSSASMPSKPTTRERQKPRRVLAAAGWSFLSARRATIPNGKLESHWGGRKSDRITEGPWIDELGVRGGARIVSGKLIRTDGKRATDHHGLQATIALGKG